MSEEQIQEMIKKAQDKIEEVKNDPKKADEYLMNAGIIDKKGNLAEPYRA